LGEVLGALSDKGVAAFVFGGVPRDVLGVKGKKSPRDWDVVVSQLTPQLLDYLGPHIRRRTRFGGFELSVGGQDFDLWALDDTWAFRENHVSGGRFADLPKTTFLNVQAIAVELRRCPKPGRKRRIYENGFFNAFATGILDINLEDNPFPHLCVLAGIHNANKLGFSISPRLTKYILHHSARMDLETLVNYQREHWPSIRYSADTLYDWIGKIRDQYNTTPGTATRLPRRKVVQMLLPW